MGADNSKGLVTKEAEKKGRPPYHDVKNPKYAEAPASSAMAAAASSGPTPTKSLMTCPASSSDSSTSSSSSSEDEEKRPEKRETKTGPKRKKADGKFDQTRHPLEGLNREEKVKKSEEMLRFLWKHPPASWSKISDVTSIVVEKTVTDGQLSEEVRREVDHEVDRTVYEVPLDHCNLRIPKNRTTRSCPDPWRRHGAHVKLCEIGGTIPENKTKTAKVIPVKKGTPPPPPPKTKPLLTMDDYMKLFKK